jgi:hypothetical protein
MTIVPITPWGRSIPKQTGRNECAATYDCDNSPKNSAGIFVPAKFIPKPSALFEARDSGLRDSVILRSSAAAHANGADHLAVRHQRIATALGDKSVAECGQVSEKPTLGEQPFEHQGRAAIARGRSRLMLRNVDRGVLAIVVLLE